MKRKFLLLVLSVFSITSLVYAQPSSCVDITFKELTGVVGGGWSFTLSWTNPTGGIKTIQVVDVAPSGCVDVCIDATASTGTETLTFSCSANPDIRIRRYVGNNCNGAFCDDELTLPIIFKTVSIRKDNDEIKLSWTAESTEAGTFEIHRSLDGKNFTSIGKVGAILGSKTYTYTDVPQVRGLVYYRLFNGKEFSRIVAVTFNTTKIQILQPDLSSFYILNFPTDGRVEIYNMNGQQVCVSRTATLLMNTPLKGVYIVVVKDHVGNKIHTEKRIIN